MRVLGIDQSLVRHRVVTAVCKGMAAKKALKPQPGAAQNSMAFDRRMRVARTAGIETAARTQEGTQRQLVDADDTHQDLAHSSTIAS
jgi:hypothetical protein